MPISSFSDLDPGTQLRLGDQLIRYDREMTRAAYSGMTEGGADSCGCSYCRNFIAQRSSNYPASFLSLLDNLGGDPTKEGEVYELGPVQGGKRQYGGWLFFTGQILKPGESLIQQDGIEYWVKNGRDLPAPNGDFGLDLLAIDFTTSIPWILDETP